MDNSEQFGASPVGTTPAAVPVPAQPFVPDQPAVSAQPLVLEQPPVLDKVWFYELDGQRFGAVSEQDMVSLIKAGTLTHGSAVWKKGFPDWMKIENTELRSHLDDLAPPPLTGEHVNNTVVWVLAFAPVIGFFIQFFIAVFFSGSADSDFDDLDVGKYWFITLSLNLALSFWDETRLEKAGIDMERASGWVWLVPVYLYQRAKTLKHNLAYFIVWLVCFGLTLL